MKKHLSIGEVSKLSGVSIRCLRYYDELGILKPVYINPETKYRFYSIEQLTTLPETKACTELDIPLKHFEEYKTKEGTVDLYKLVQTGELLAHQKIAHLEQIILKLKSLSEYLATIQKIRQVETPFYRQINKRSLVVSPFYGDISNEYDRIKSLTELYEKMKVHGITVLYQQGFLFKCKDGKRGIPYSFLEVVNVSELDYDTIEIPSGKYQCEVFSFENIEQVYTKMLDNNISSEPSLVLFVDYLDDTQSRYIEIQKTPLKCIPDL